MDISKDKILAAAKTVLNNYLKDRNMRRTPERYAILEKVFSTDAHFYVDALHEAIIMEGIRVSLSTVYATVQLFLEAGLVRRHQFGNQPAQYERVIQGIQESHHHLVCNCCGRVRPIRNSELPASIESMKFGTFKPEFYTLYVYGLCARCRKRNEAVEASKKLNQSSHNRK